MRSAISLLPLTGVEGDRTSVAQMSTSSSSSQRQRNRSSRSRSSHGSRTVSGTPTLIPTTPAGPLAGIEEERARSGRWPWIAAMVCGAIAGVFGALVSIPGGPIVMIPVFIVVAVAVSVFVHHNAATASIHAIGATKVELSQVPRVEALLDSLSASFGVAIPELALLDDPVPNAAIVSHRGAKTIIVTTGLLARCSVVELEGVLGHLLARERLGWVERATSGGGIALLLGPLGRRGSLSHSLIGRGALFRSDEIAAATVRYPTGLAHALGIMIDGDIPAKGSFFSSGSYDTLRWLFIDPSVARRSQEEAFDDVDATSVRRAALLEW